MSRRTRIAVATGALLIAAYFGVTSWIRAHVNDLIQHAVGKPLPEFALADRGGRTWTTADLRGKRALLHFFRSHCHSCDVEAPAVRELEQRLPADAVLLHVMTDAVLGFPPDVTLATLAGDSTRPGKGFTAPVLMADAKFVDAFHQVKWSNVTPITYVIDAQGVVRYGLRGAQTLDTFEQALAASR